MRAVHYVETGEPDRICDSCIAHLGGRVEVISRPLVAVEGQRCAGCWQTIYTDSVGKERK